MSDPLDAFLKKAATDVARNRCKICTNEPVARAIKAFCDKRAASDPATLQVSFKYLRDNYLAPELGLKTSLTTMVEHVQSCLSFDARVNRYKDKA